MNDQTPETTLPLLSESDLDPDPINEFARWFRAAEESGIIMADAVALATATTDGKPSVRMVLLKGFDHQGFVFYTNYESRKGRELQQNPYAALVFYWDRLSRQVRISGTVEKVSREESIAYFHSRPFDSQLSAWASRQSEVVLSREVLEERMRELAAEYVGREVPLPPYWGGFRVFPDSIEFWQGRLSRLHDRFRYSRRSGDHWTLERLSP